MPNTVLWRGATAARTSRVRGRSVNGDAQSAVLASRTSCHEPRLTRTRRRTAPRRQGCRSHGTVLVDGDDHVHRHGEVGTRGLRHRISCGDAAGARDRRCRMRARRAAGLLACCLMTRRVGVLSSRHDLEMVLRGVLVSPEGSAEADPKSARVRTARVHFSTSLSRPKRRRREHLVKPRQSRERRTRDFQLGERSPRNGSAQF